MTAYLDESVLGSGSSLTYVVAAAVIVNTDAVAAREKLSKLLLPGQARFHYRDESAARRLAMLDTIAELDVRAYVTWHYPTGRRRQEHARALCLTALLGLLSREHVEDVVIERRDPHGNRRDAKTIRYARDSGIGGSIRYEFGNPRTEPFLWIPDAIAGAMSASQMQGATPDGLRLTVLHVERAGA